MKILTKISQFLIGAVFTFSGIVKAVDPLGSQYKFQDYFVAMGMEWLIPLALILGIILSSAEFLVGISLLLNLKPKIGMWGAIVFMVVFTPLTLWIAIKNPVTDCGCFGDALVISNWATFYKNLIIDFLIVILFFGNKYLQVNLFKNREWWAVGFITVLILSFQIFTLRHLPVIDFRPYKIGAYIPDGMSIPADAPKGKSVYNYYMKNMKTGEEKKITSDEYLQDTTWQNTQKYELLADKIEGPFVIEKGYVPPIHDFTIEPISPFTDEYITFDSDIAPQILSDDRYIVLMVAYDINLSNEQAFKKSEEFYQELKKLNIPLFLLTGSSKDGVDKKIDEFKFSYPVANTDPITLKTIVRANPGFVLLKNGNIVDKWNFRELPEIDYFKKLK